ncbi:MAG: lanthionine synthetase C family protein, partial [Actinomycetota bacterium]|nr:lanthionine synthetase C family protein [Actinomycetota bacterium]
STLHAPAPLAPPGLAAEARSYAELLIRRLADPDLVAEAVAKSQRSARYPFGWGGASLAAGPAGSALALRYAARVLPDGDWAARSDQQLVDAVHSTHELPLVEAGLAAGTAGLALTFADCARDDTRYATARHTLDTKLALQVIEAPKWRSDHGVRDGDYDIVLGAAGILAYLASVPKADAVLRRAIGVLVDDLIWLCAPRPGGQSQPWFIPPEHYPLDDYQDQFPHGYVNLGLAHGIPGPLAALCFAASAGYRHDLLLDTIRHVATYLVAVSLDDECGRNWSMGVPLTDTGAQRRTGQVPTRTAWCYGAPGIACALLLAAETLADDGLRAVAIDTFDGVLRRVAVYGGFPSATLCHGAAGALAMCVRFARDTGSVLAQRALPALTEQLLAHCDPDLLLGVQDLEQPGILLDSPGLLTGSAGVALALWSASTPIPARWERALLIT